MKNSILSDQNSVSKDLLFTRWEHGNEPVTVYQSDSGREMYEHGGSFHQSARSLLRAVTGNPHVSTSFDRYFRRGKYSPSDSSGNILRLLDEGSSNVIVDGTLRPVRATPTVILDGSPANSSSKSPNLLSISPNQVSEGQKKVSATLKEVSVPPKRTLKVQKEDLETRFGGTESDFGGIEGETSGLVADFLAELDATFPFPAERVSLGIDLETRSHEVAKLLHAGFRGKMLSRGYDPEDVLQEVYKGLLARNAGTCPWDPRKASFGYYVHMVINCVLTNYHRKQSRRKDREWRELDSDSSDDSGGSMEGLYHTATKWVEVGDPESMVSEGMARTSLDRWLEGQGRGRPEADVAREILPLVTEGMRRGEIVERTGKPDGLVAKALAWLRKQTREWARTVGVLEPA